MSSLLFPSFLAGLLTFLAPCTLPLVPAYLGVISGVRLDELKAGEARGRVFLNGLAFVAGFTLIFLIFGLAASSIGAALSEYRSAITRVGGLVAIAMGVVTLLGLPFWKFDTHATLPESLKPGNPLTAFVLGVVFAVGWTPCIGPILATILFYAASQEHLGQGATLLLMFSLGHAIPFLIVAFGYGSLVPLLSRLRAAAQAVTVTSGLFLIVLGVLLLFNAYGSVSGTVFSSLRFLHYDAILKYL